MSSRRLGWGAVGLALALPVLAEEPVDLGVVTRLRDEGLHRSQVMEYARHLTDEIGPRLTGSPQHQAAAEWAREQLRALGLAKAHLETFPFRQGWSFSACAVRAVRPFEAPLRALPKAWSPGTAGEVSGLAMTAKIEKAEDLEALKGKVKGKILFLDEARETKEDGAPIQRYSEKELADLFTFEIPPEKEKHPWIEEARKRWVLSEKINRFLVEEGAVATVELSSRDNGVVRVMGGGSLGVPERSRGVPALLMAAEPYERILRLLAAGGEIELALDVRATYHDGPREAWNVLAEIPGSDPAGEIVMAGAHLDSWHGGTGATDNAAGSAVVLEAARLLESLGVTPKRTIRFALWGGEEQGLLGSRAYVREHFATRPKPSDVELAALPDFLWGETWPIAVKPEHAKLAAYFNLDNGGGKIRGIYAEENAAARPIFSAWLAPFADLGATVVTLDRTGGTDHQSFDRVGLPGFQFVQDELDYSVRTHHTELDTYEHLHREDLMQAAVIMASFLYDAAMRPERFPRKPLPAAPPAKPDKAGKPAPKQEPAR